MLRRLLCVLQLPPPLHGASVMNKAVVESKALRAAFELDVVPLRFAESLEDLGSGSFAKLWKAAAVAVSLCRRIVRNRPDAAYVTLSPAGAAFYRDCGYVAVLKLLSVPRIYHLHGKGVRARLDSGWRTRLYRWAFEGAHVIHLSPALGTDLAGLVPSDHLHFVANGVPDHARGATPSGRVGVPRVLFVSNMIREKGALDLLRALSVLRDRGVMFDATFAGARSGDGCLEELLNGIKSLDLAGCVQYVGPQYDSDKHRLFAAHDVFAFPTYYSVEAFPLVVLEAFQWGLPVVTTRQGAIADMVEDGETGFVVEPRDHEGLADRLETLLTERELRLAMGQRARATYENKYTLQRFESALLRVLTDCVEAHDVSSPERQERGVVP